MFMVCGEALMDVFSAGDSTEGVALDARVGGSPFNVARGLARLGREVGFLSAVSTDFLGERLMRALREEGVDTRWIARLNAPTTLSLVGLDESGAPAYAFHGTGCADRLLQPQHLRELPAGVRALHFGSYAMVVEPSASTLRALAAAERGRRLIAYDPNVRLNVEPDLARWRETVEGMARQADLIKVSDEDLSLLYPNRPPQAVADAWLAAGCALVVVTRGAEGALAFRRGERLQVQAPATVVVDTVGAGDTFQAALLSALGDCDALSAATLAALERPRLEQALRFAARAAALTCSRRGADLPRAAELR
ncbi:carbohydrate kinase family protein [Azohydromonas caseinilytica]|uniref:Carbohydrate kinase n=1 Tax=Azohydromonas caseinilytica TaxID=2728836 RepID=A0A848FIL7_9BURK|nr:carbohydrate kinase [Azohydromonas caseinilytica]NML18050.1 carbohydrate kinase [Azohydromonas caseinilytica]